MHVSTCSVFFKFCLTSAGLYDICIITAGMIIGKVKLQQALIQYIIV